MSKSDKLNVKIIAMLCTLDAEGEKHLQEIFDKAASHDKLLAIAERMRDAGCIVSGGVTQMPLEESKGQVLDHYKIRCARIRDLEQALAAFDEFKKGEGA